MEITQELRLEYLRQLSDYYHNKGIKTAQAMTRATDAEEVAKLQREAMSNASAASALTEALCFIEGRCDGVIEKWVERDKKGLWEEA